MTPEEAQNILSAYAVWQQNIANYQAPELRHNYDQLVMDFMREWVYSVAKESDNVHRHEITEIIDRSPYYQVKNK